MVLLSPTRAIAAFGVVCFLASAIRASPQVVGRASVDSTGAQSNNISSQTVSRALSADGRWITFTSSASNLVAGDTNATSDAFVKDRLTGATTRVSVGSGGVQADNGTLNGCISADGRWVAFTSTASNLVAGDTNAREDIFLHDRLTGTTERISISSGGGQSDGYSVNPSVSDDARFVSFTSLGTNLVAGDTNGVIDIFVRDRQLATTTRVSVSTLGAQSDGWSVRSVLSADGRWVLFDSAGSTLVANDANGQYDIFLHDRTTSTTVRVSQDITGLDPDGGSTYPSLSPDARWVLFQSSASDLVQSDTNGSSDAFVHDRLLGTTVLVSLGVAGAQGNGQSWNPHISADGRRVAFASTSSNLVAGDTNAAQDIFLHDTMTGVTTRTSVDLGGQEADENCIGGHISADGRWVTFHGAAANLVVGDTNNASDVFLIELPEVPTGVAFCFGDGTGTTCPCGNAGASDGGCASSVSATGARLEGRGIARVTTDTLELVGARMPNSSALYFQGTANTLGGLGIAFGDGLRCAGGSVIRLGTEFNVAGMSIYPGVGDPTVSVRGLDAPGDTRTYQVWYRNAASFCTTSTFNLTNGLRVLWGA